ncbi:MAG: hypothetical protein QOJ35_1605 [Solirubrobacteraceae bacterium]|jgi:hypothetical protein|nr:hypothetical protein [Solirubrobacteraceae bacterium]
MLDRFLDALTGRRLGGALFVLLGLVVAGVVLWPSGGDGGARPRAVGIQPSRIVSVPQLGLAFAYPSTWSRTVAGRVIRLRSPEGSAVMTFASPAEGSFVERVTHDTRAALRKQLAPSSVVRAGPARLGGRPGRTFELRGIDADGSVRLLVIVGSSPYRTYVVSLLTPPSPSAKRLAEVERILATVRLTRPRQVATGG